jgi:tetratricopeptide (TPR) repeat protein
MAKLLLIAALFLFPGPYASAQDGGGTAAPASYDQGMAQRKRGEYGAAKETFLKLLAQSPDSGGALEGLALTCLSLGQYAEAQQYLERWNARSPRNPYVLGLLARAQNAQRDEEGALNTYTELAACDPRDCAARSRLDSSMERLRAGVFPRGRSYKSYSMEGLDTANPQRIVYAGNSAGSRFRVPLKAGLDLVGGAEIREEAQRNDGRRFTYYDILDQVYSAGLAGRPTRDLKWEAEYGQSVLSDIKASGVGNRLFSRARLSGELHRYDSDFRLVLTRSPKFLRGSFGTKYFRLLGENAARVEAETARWNWNWLARAGLYATSDGTTMGTYSTKGLREFGANLAQAGYAHGQQEFYSASASGRLRYVHTDRLSLGLRRTVEESYRAGASYAYTSYSDSNRLHELDTELTGWLPWQKEFSGTYRFSLQDFGTPRDGYTSIDARAHWLGAYWRRCHGKNWAAMVGYERGFLHDVSRGSYGGNNYLAEVEWYRGASASVRAQGRKSDTTVRDRSYSVGLQARYSFR